MKKTISLRDVVFYLFVLLALLLSLSLLTGQKPREAKLVYSDIRQLLEQQKVQELWVKDNAVHLLLRPEGKEEGKTVSYPIYSFPLFYEDLNELIVREWQMGRLERYDYPPPELPSWWERLLPYLSIALIGFLLWRLFSQQSQGGGGGEPGNRFGKARTRTLEDQGKPVTFADVAGADEEKNELQELVDFLRDPNKFISLGAHIPKGVLLVGPPGTGKTLLAKAVAGEAGVQFLSISGSDFVELYVGVGASRVRDLFDEAKKDSPAIVFIDEIDAVGRQRGTGLGGGHDEREQTLNQLLVEMDGFGSNEGVIVLAATNRVDILDPALLRPGRFDRQVYVGLPDIKGRQEILKIHARGKPLGEDVRLEEVARSTGGFTGADLENLMNEAALLAVRRNHPILHREDIFDSILKVIAGPEKRSRVILEKERRLTAYHEAGHAIVIHELGTADPVHQITIVPRGQAGGMTISLPREDLSYHSKEALKEQIVRCLGGRAAEQLVLGDVSTGASNDLERATSIARSMVTKYGMSDKLGNVVFDSGHDEIFIGRSMAQAKPYSEATAHLIDSEVKELIDHAYRQCQEILTRRRSELEEVAVYLLEHETMDAEIFEKVFRPQ